MPKPSRSRASSTMPSRFATDSRARTRGLLRSGRAWRSRQGRAAGPGQTRRRAVDWGRVYRLTWHTPEAHPHDLRGCCVTLAPWEYLFIPFNSANFPDIFHPTWIASLALLVILVILYNVRDS